MPKCFLIIFTPYLGVNVAVEPVHGLAESSRGKIVKWSVPRASGATLVVKYIQIMFIHMLWWLNPCGLRKLVGIIWTTMTL